MAAWLGVEVRAVLDVGAGPACGGAGSVGTGRGSAIAPSTSRRTLAASTATSAATSPAGARPGSSTSSSATACSSTSTPPPPSAPSRTSARCAAACSTSRPSPRKTSPCSIPRRRTWRSTPAPAAGTAPARAPLRPGGAGLWASLRSGVQLYELEAAGCAKRGEPRPPRRRPSPGRPGGPAGEGRASGGPRTRRSAAPRPRKE